ncbi:helix-turn-helix domain-containing protein [Rugosimonospora acidiphila]|uniref:Helix-turn-helix domain-containing protein n=1 Tax=Rugosimonospora acidiphila TaxID=556531 RepID=A0ABP9RHE6_9ACTN
MATNPATDPTAAANASAGKLPARPGAAHSDLAGPGLPMAPNGDPLISDIGMMRAMSHPARIQILEHLSQNGPSTATECAEIVGLSPSATSYHLRALAKVGLIEEAPGRGDARERVWRSTVAGGYSVDAGVDATPEARAAEDGLISTFLAWEDAQTRKFLARRMSEPAEWQRAVQLSQMAILVTADELKALGGAIEELVRQYRKRDRVDPPPDARTVSVMLRAFPTDDPTGAP